MLLKPVRDDNLLYGAGRSTLDLARALGRPGVEVDVLQWHHSPLPIKSEYVHLFRVRVSGTYGLLKLSCAAARAIRQTNSEAVYAYADYYENTFVSAYLGSLLTRKKLLVAVLDDGEREIDEHSLPRALARRHASKHSFRSSMRFMFFHALRRFALRTTAVSVVSSGYVAAYAKDVLKARRVFVIGRGIDGKWFGRTSNLQKYDAIYVGGLWRFKSVDVLISAWKEVVRSKPGAKLLIVGEGGERRRCERLAVELGISEVVVFRGHVDDPNEVHELLSESRVFVFPSVKEGLPRAVGEAMATGLPCVLSDIPVFKELYSQMAILVPAGKPTLFAEAILNLLEDKVKYDEMARRAAEAASERTWETVARRMLWVLQNT